MVAVAPPPRVALTPNAVAFRDPQHGLMGTGWRPCAYSSTSCRAQGTVSITSDGGRTWNVLFRTPRPVVSVSVDGSHERAVFDDGETIGSSDGGRHWLPVVVGQAVTGPCPSGAEAFVLARWALCGWGQSAGNQIKAVYHLGGNGWRRVAITPTGRAGVGILDTYGYAEGITMAPNGFGLIWESRGTLHVTRDGGAHWYGLPRIAVPETDFGYSAAALPHGVGFALLERGGGIGTYRLVETKDAGRSWRVVHVWK